MVNMSTDDWVTSYAPIGNLNSSYQTDVEGIGKKQEQKIQKTPTD